MGYPIFRQTRDELWQFLLDSCLSMSGFHVWFQVRTEADWCIPGTRVPQKCLGMPWKETLPPKILSAMLWLVNWFWFDQPLWKMWSTAMNMIHPAMTISSPASASGICLLASSWKTAISTHIILKQCSHLCCSLKTQFLFDTALFVGSILAFVAQIHFFLLA